MLSGRFMRTVATAPARSRTRSSFMPHIVDGQCAKCSQEISLGVAFMASPY